MLDLPPLFRAVTLREGADAFAYACRRADELGAGTLAHVDAFGYAEFAVVLEPEEPLADSRRVLYAGMVALGDALAALAPPEKPIVIGWPDALYVDGGLVGGGRLGWPAEAAEDAVPRWLVFGAMIRLSFPAGIEPGQHPGATALAEEGFVGSSSARLVEVFARHFMVTMNAWQEDGFGVVAKSYLAELEPEPGLRYALADSGDLLLQRTEQVERRSLITALMQPSWLAAETGEPRL